MKLRPENEMLAMCVLAIVIIVLASCLSGCMTTQPVSGCPKVDIPTAPKYAIEDLNAQSSRADISRAWVTSLYQCNGALERCSSLLEGTQ